MNADAIPKSTNAGMNTANSTPAFPSLPVADNGRVRLGGQAPLFRSALADDCKVRLGGQSPLFLPAAIADSGLVRLGGQRPTF